MITLSILRCSWTRRPYTVYSWGELVRSGYVHSGHNIPLASRLDKKLAKAIENHHDNSILFSWDVVGVIA